MRNGLHFPVPTSPRLQPTCILYAPRGKSNPNNTLTLITHTPHQRTTRFTVNWELLKGHFRQHGISLTLPLKRFYSKSHKQQNLSLIRESQFAERDELWAEAQSRSESHTRRRLTRRRRACGRRELRSHGDAETLPSRRSFVAHSAVQSRRQRYSRYDFHFLNFFPCLVAEKSWVKVDESFGNLSL